MKAATGIETSRGPSGRVSWIDAVKGLGIALIVLGHIASVETPSTLYLYIYAFHVPLFFFVSGLTLKPGRETFGAMLMGKGRSLLVPYFFYALLGYAFYLVGYGMAQALGLRIEQFNYGPWHPLIGIFIGTLGDGNLVNTHELRDLVAERYPESSVAGEAKQGNTTDTALVTALLYGNPDRTLSSPT